VVVGDEREDGGCCWRCIGRLHGGSMYSVGKAKKATSKQNGEVLMANLKND